VGHNKNTAYFKNSFQNPKWKALFENFTTHPQFLILEPKSNKKIKKLKIYIYDKLFNLIEKSRGAQPLFIENIQ
jgi:hypothetical protein